MSRFSFAKSASITAGVTFLTTAAAAAVNRFIVNKAGIPTVTEGLKALGFQAVKSAVPGLAGFGIAKAFPFSGYTEKAVLVGSIAAMEVIAHESHVQAKTGLAGAAILSVETGVDTAAALAVGFLADYCFPSDSASADPLQQQDL